MAAMQYAAGSVEAAAAVAVGDGGWGCAVCGVTALGTLLAAADAAAAAAEAAAAALMRTRQCAFPRTCLP